MLCCASCEVVLKHPFSPCCGHLFCRQCITSNREQSALPGHCPKKSRVELKADRGGGESATNCDCGCQTGNKILDELFGKSQTQVLELV